MTIRTRLLAGVAPIAVFLGIATAAPANAFTLQILHNNDGESELLNVGAGREDFGGIHRYVATIEGLRATSTADASITLSSGDNFLPGPELDATLATLGTSNPIFYDKLGLDLIGYDAIAFGNHDFDRGTQFLSEFLQFGDQSVPYVATNIDFSNVPELDALATAGRITSSTVITRGAEQIGIVGAIYEDLANISSPGATIVNDVIASVNAEVANLQGAGVNKIVLISHLQDITEEEAVIPFLFGVDVVIAGGGDELLANPGDELIPGDVAARPYPITGLTNADGAPVVAVTTSGNYAYVGELEVEFDADGNVIGFSGGPRIVQDESLGGPAIGSSANAQQALDEIVTPVTDFIANLDTIVLAISEEGLDATRPNIRTTDTNAGDLVTDAFLWQAKQILGDDAVDIAIANGGGIRNNTFYPAGEFTAADAAMILPFGNILGVLEDVTIERLVEVFESSYDSLPGQDGGFLHFSGLEVVVNPNAPVGGRVFQITLVNDPDDPSDDVLLFLAGDVLSSLTLDIATLNFTAGGGDGLPLGDLPFTLLGFGDKESLAAYLTADPAIGGLGGVISAEQYPLAGQGRFQIPVPASVLLFGLGALAFGVMRRRAA